jgi:hypothetical protein
MPRLTKSKQVQVTDSLVEFCDDIEATGGIRPNPEDPGSGQVVPVADDEWVDLADTYRKACRALGRKPKVEG